MPSPVDALLDSEVVAVVAFISEPEFSIDARVLGASKVHYLRRAVDGGLGVADASARPGYSFARVSLYIDSARSFVFAGTVFFGIACLFGCCSLKDASDFFIDGLGFVPEAIEGY